ncbi:MAG: EFR1 family ferrodoxin [Eubacteriales bacterium]|nr:EFR1 family ferrodoxin [Eubacteriales bacterium]
MDKAVIFYFSGTGNTWWVTKKIAESLKSREISTDIHSIENISLEEADTLISMSKYVGFGYPIYGSDLPETMKNFMSNLQPVDQKNTFLFCTQWLFSGDGTRNGASFIKDKGFFVRWSEHFFMPNNISITNSVFSRFYTNDGTKHKKRLTHSLNRANILADKISNSITSKRGYGVLPVLFGLIQRFPYRIMFPKLRNDISINYTRCILCERCVNNCPVDNLEIVQGEVSARGQCILCLRCYNFCPVGAVQYKGKDFDRERGRPYQGPVQIFQPEFLTKSHNNHIN